MCADCRDLVCFAGSERSTVAFRLWVLRKHQPCRGDAIAYEARVASLHKIEVSGVSEIWLLSLSCFQELLLLADSDACFVKASVQKAPGLRASETMAATDQWCQKHLPRPCSSIHSAVPWVATVAKSLLKLCLCR